MWYMSYYILRRRKKKEEETYYYENMILLLLLLWRKMTMIEDNDNYDSNYYDDRELLLPTNEEMWLFLIYLMTMKAVTWYDEGIVKYLSIWLIPVVMNDLYDEAQ